MTLYCRENLQAKDSVLKGLYGVGTGFCDSFFVISFFVPFFVPAAFVPAAFVWGVFLSEDFLSIFLWGFCYSLFLYLIPVVRVHSKSLKRYDLFDQL